MESRDACPGISGPSRAQRVDPKPSWAKYWAFARFRLGLTEDAFFALTPALFAELNRQWEAERREELTLVAMLRTDLINFSMRAPKRAITVADLLPSDTPTKKTVKVKRHRNRSQVADGLRNVLNNWER
jgi:hypothetical protein